MTRSAVLLMALAGAIAAAPTAHPAHNTSDNYAGLVKFGEEIVGASVDLIIPECLIGTPNTTFSDYTSDGWVGISAYAGPDSGSTWGLLQTGINCNINRNYNESTNEFTTPPTLYQAWTEWAPAPPIFFNSSASDFLPGDRIHGRVHAIGRTGGTTYLKNHRTGKEYTYTFEDQTALLGSTNAEWITENETGYTPENGADGILTANYTTWQYENAAYITSDGKSHLAGPVIQIDTVLYNTTVAKTVYHSPGKFQVNDVWPANFTLGL